MTWQWGAYSHGQVCTPQLAQQYYYTNLVAITTALGKQMRY